MLFIALSISNILHGMEGNNQMFNSPAHFFPKLRARTIQLYPNFTVSSRGGLLLVFGESMEIIDSNTHQGTSVSPGMTFPWQDKAGVSQNAGSYDEDEQK
jgi:hypothetical protein